ncbi:MAG TPA: patatin family protein [Clostridiaceae bacterium]|nr:patatin family protein [Clostridiaceae bacterium]
MKSKRMEKLKNNIHDTALIFEGGGMRASFSSGVLNVLLEEEYYFDYVCGVSAGASCTINYLSRDQERARKSFIDIAKYPEFGGWGHFVKGNGFFNAKWIYEETCRDILPFDIDTFNANPARMKISAIEADSALPRFWDKTQLTKLEQLVQAVRASSTLPIMMPPLTIDGKIYYDGGLRNGLELDTARNDGMTRFVVVLTREKNYRKTIQSHRPLLRFYLRRYPKLLKLLAQRHLNYNKTLDELSALENSGHALLIYPEKMAINSSCRDLAALEANYEQGYRQARQILPKLENFLKSN